MKEYDIYLKKRIHESKLFIYSIPYRDGVSVTNRLILEAMLSYYTLQKSVAAESKTALVAEIDEIINIVHEKIGAGMEIQTRADFFARYYNELEKEAIELGVPDLPAFLRFFFSVERAMQIRVSNIDAIAKSSIGDTNNAIAISIDDIPFSEIVFETIKSGMEIGAKIKRTHKQAFETVHSDLQIDTPDLNLFYCYATGAETAMTIAASLADIEIHYSLGDANDAMVIQISEPDSIAEKRLNISTQLSLYCQMAATVISYFESENGVSVTATGSAGLKRYRLLNEMDDLSLSDLDDFTLEELDYVELT